MKFSNIYLVRTDDNYLSLFFSKPYKIYIYKQSYKYSTDNPYGIPIRVYKNTPEIDKAIWNEYPTQSDIKKGCYVNPETELGKYLYDKYKTLKFDDSPIKL